MNKKQIEYLPIDQIRMNDWNPNVQDDKVFVALQENIAETGMDEPLLVYETEEEGVYKIINGEHRFRASQEVGLEEVPCVITTMESEDMAKFQTVRRHVLQGEMDPIKFTELFNEMADKYGEEQTKQLMQFVDENAFNDLYLQVKESLPDEMKDEFEEKSKDKGVDDVDSLSKVLDEMFSKHGDTLDQNFMVFTYGGKTHLWVLMDDELKRDLMDNVLKQVKEKNVDITDFFKKALKGTDDLLAGIEGMEEDVEY
jgi:ParB/RepB/Spo0J family partition protein